MKNETIQFNIKDNKEETIKEIMIIRQEVAIMGSNDYEIPALDGLIESLKKGEVLSKDALAEAIKIRNSKQDYH